MTRRDEDEAAYAPVAVRWDDRVPAHRPNSPELPDMPQEAAVTWPSAVYPGQYGHPTQTQYGQLTLNALLAPDMPRPAVNKVAAWPGWPHVWPGAATASWTGLGFWAHTEPLHALFATGFGLAGTLLVGAGALGILAANAHPRDADDEPADKAGPRGLLAGGIAAWAGAASTGAGFSGIGCMLAAGLAGGGYGAAWAWRQYARHRAVRAVIDYAAASNVGPLPPAGLPLPQVFLPDNRLPANPYEHRLRQALSAMRIDGVWFGSPMKVAEDTWRLPFELPAGANLSPQALAKKEDVIANNARARRIEIDPTHGALGTITVYDGPDRTDETYTWNGTLIKSVEKPFVIAYEEAARPTEIDFTEHILVTGRTRMGKSALLRYLLTATVECHMVRLGVDCKDGAPGLGMLEPLFHELATDAMDGWRQQFGIKGIAAVRGQWMRRRGIDAWDLADGPRVVAVIDELAELVLRYPDSTDIQKSNLALVAAAAITKLDATQSPSRAVFGKNTDARKQYGKRIGFKNDQEANNMVFGGLPGYRTQDLDAAGKMLLSSLEHQRPRRHKAVWMDRDQALAIIERYADHIPALDAMSLEGYEAGKAAFDEAIAAGLNPLETFEPPPVGGGDGPRSGRRGDPIDAAQEFHGQRANLRLVTTYPGTDEPIELKHLALWNLLGEYGADGAFAMDLAAKQLDGFTSESNVRLRLRAWADRGFVESVKDGRADRFWRVDVADAQVRMDA